MVNRRLDHLKGSLNGTVEHGHRITKTTSMFKSIENWTQSFEGVVVIEKGLCEWFFCKTGT